MKYLFFILCIASVCLHSQQNEEYLFQGRHFLASYNECDMEALANVEEISKAMYAAAEASGATVLKGCEHIFSPNGITMVILLSESHASIHTYPEHGSCFVDLFTCGDHCSHEKFDAVLRAYLKPKKIDARLLLRSETIENH